MSRIGKKPIADPRRRHRDARRPDGHGEGPQGRARPGPWSTRSRSRRRTASSRSTPRDDSQRARAMWGLSRTLVANMVQGVTQGYEQTLELVGVGYRAAMKGQALSMQLGFSHDVDIPPPAGHHLRRAQADRDQDQRHRQAAGRRNRRPHPQDPPARALQGQGRALRRREGPPQGRQEEVGHGAFHLATPPSAAPSASARA